MKYRVVVDHSFSFVIYRFQELPWWQRKMIKKFLGWEIKKIESNKV